MSTRPQPSSPPPFTRRFFHVLFALLFTAAMTVLTYCKETNIYWREIDGWRADLHWLAMKTYYPVWFLNLTVLFVLLRQNSLHGWSRWLLRLAVVVFAVNFTMLSANNVINIILRRPLHSSHQGIGW